MYEQFFGFRQRPFASAPHPRNYIPLESTESTREKLVRAVVRAEGPGLLIGPPGTGKSLLLRVLAEQLRQKFEVVLLSHGRFPSVRALLQSILCELRQPFRGLDEGELRLSLIEYVTMGEGSSPLVLLVDEADTLPFRLLEEIRTLLNIMRRDEPAVRLILAGGTALEERLTAPKLQMLSQRISARCYLDALNRSETFFYIREQISRAGQKAEQIFPEPSCQAVYHATGGVPRLINQVCDHALILAFADGLKSVSPEIVQQAWSDLQQFPLPWEPPKPSPSSQSVIEFGTWTEDQDIPGRPNGSPDQVGPDHSAMVGGSAGNCDPQDTRAKGWAFSGPHGELSPPIGETDATEVVDSARAIIESLAAQVPPGPNAGLDAAATAPEGLLDRPDPVARLEDLTQAVADLQKDLSPQTGQKPEVELVFYDWGDPFEETFAKEIPVQSRATPMPREGASRATPAMSDSFPPRAEAVQESPSVQERPSSPDPKTEPTAVPRTLELDRTARGDNLGGGLSLTEAETPPAEPAPTASAGRPAGQTAGDPRDPIRERKYPLRVVRTSDLPQPEKADEQADLAGQARHRTPEFRSLFSRLRKQA